MSIERRKISPRPEPRASTVRALAANASRPRVGYVIAFAQLLSMGLLGCAKTTLPGKLVAQANIPPASDAPATPGEMANVQPIPEPQVTGGVPISTHPYAGGYGFGSDDDDEEDDDGDDVGEDAEGGCPLRR